MRLVGAKGAGFMAESRGNMIFMEVTCPSPKLPAMA